MRRRRESVASVYRKTTKFLSTNTAILLKKMPNNRKYRLLTKIIDEYANPEEIISKKDTLTNDDDDLGDLDYYLGARKKETYWRDLEGKEQIRRDYLLYHCGITEEEYEKEYKKVLPPKASLVIQPRLKQVPFKINRKKKNSQSKDDSWRDKSGIFKLFAYRRDSETTSESYSECDSNEEVRDDGRRRLAKDDNVEDALEKLSLEVCKLISFVAFDIYTTKIE